MEQEFYTVMVSILTYQLSLFYNVLRSIRYPSHLLKNSNQQTYTKVVLLFIEFQMSSKHTSRPTDTVVTHQGQRLVLTTECTLVQ